MNLQTGAFGDPASTETLILFWAKWSSCITRERRRPRATWRDRLRR